MMILDVLTGFPEMFAGLVNSSILRQALLADAVDIWIHNLRHFAVDRHGTIDDAPYGGGAGMILMAQPVWRALDRLIAIRGHDPYRVFLTPQGQPLTQEVVRELARRKWIVLLCGHYKDVDARILERDPWREISIGDYVVSGGELPAAVLIDAVVRCLPGVLQDSASAASDSFEEGLLDAPYYTRPEEVEGLRVPAPLLSGNHKEICRWRYRQRIERTRARRPDLWAAWRAQHPDLPED